MPRDNGRPLRETRQPLTCTEAISLTAASGASTFATFATFTDVL